MELPLMVSFPRTGTHWVTCVTELYFDRPRAEKGRFTFLDPKRTDYMFRHWHDTDGKRPVVKDILYLYRNPVPTIFSFLMWKGNDPKTVDEKRIEQISNWYCKSLKKHIPVAKTIIKYERLQKNRMQEFQKIVKHFDGVWQEELAIDAFRKASKKNIQTSHKADRHKKCLTEKYKQSRQQFKSVWGEFINEKVMNESMKTMLEKYDDQS